MLSVSKAETGMSKETEAPRVTGVGKGGRNKKRLEGAKEPTGPDQGQHLALTERPDPSRESSKAASGTHKPGSQGTRADKKPKEVTPSGSWRSWTSLGLVSLTETWGWPRHENTPQVQGLVVARRQVGGGWYYGCRQLPQQLLRSQVDSGAT